MLQLKHICKSYVSDDFTQVALDDVSVTFRDSEFVCVLGPSGSGKTTMLNILGGLDHADSGDIVINGVSTKDYRSRDWDSYRNHRVGFIFQSYNLIPHQTILANVELALTLSGVGRSERRQRAREALEAVGLADHVRKRPSQLSGGQMQRVAIARALVNDPDIVLADEPTGALDTETGIQVMDILQEVAADRLVVMVTHNPELAEQYATRIVRVRDGHVVGDTNPLSAAELARAEAEGAAGPDAAATSGEARAAGDGAAGADADATVLMAPPAGQGAGAAAGADAAMEGGASAGPDETARLAAPAPAASRQERDGKRARRRAAAPSDTDDHASMGFLTALSLSFNNLMTKKGRTFLTAFAGSIGIIGIAAILAISNGVNNYIAKTEQDTLSSYPLQVSKSSTDMGSIMGAMSDYSTGGGDAASDGSGGDARPAGTDDIPESTIVADVFSKIHTNDLGSFKTYLESGQSDIGDHVSTIVYRYGVQPKFYSSDTADGITEVGSPLGTARQGSAQAAMGSLMGGSSAAEGFEQMIDDTDLLDSQYDVLAGRWPKAADECILVLGPDGTISDYMLYALGVLDPQQFQEMVSSVSSNSGAAPDVPDTSVSMTYDDALKMTFKAVSPSALYRKNDETGTWNSAADDADYMKGVLDNDAVTLKVVGVVRPNAQTSSGSLTQGVAYTSALTSELIDYAANSQIVKDQQADPDVDVFTGKTFEELQKGATSAFDMQSLFTIDQDALKKAFSFDASKLQGAMGSGSGSLDLSGIDAGALDFDPSKMQVDTSQLQSAFSADTVAKLMAGAPQPDFTNIGTDPAATPEQQQKVNEAATDIIKDFIPQVLPEIAQISAGQNADEATKKVQEKWQAYVKTPEGAAKVQALRDAEGEAYGDAIQHAMDSYVQDELAPYLAQGMGQIMSQAAQAMAAQMAQSLQSQIAQATQSLGSQLSASISSQLQQQMGSLSSSLSDAFSVDPAAFASAIHFNLSQDDLASLMQSYANASQLSYDNNLQALGYADLDQPSEIDLYPKSFDDKQAVEDGIDAYNDMVSQAGDDAKQISYSDVMGSLMSSVTDIVNMVSMVLIAFVSISLVVSSIMIAIITYISVLERKKEIGILRAMGASKLNVASIFNAETIIEGLLAGVLAIVMVYAASVPVNAWVLSWRHVENIMSLPPQAALALIGISVALTLVAGLIPSSMAARRDPVEALRSE